MYTVDETERSKVRNPDGRVVAECPHNDDARAIARALNGNAPELLEALQRVRACLSSTQIAIPCDPRNPEFIQYVDDICREAIAQATA